MKKNAPMTARQTSQFQRGLLKWFDANRRDLPWRNTVDPYKVWVSEVMLQQTQVNTVVPYFQRFITKYPDVPTLAAADLQNVLKEWENLGYYARARNLHRAAGILCENSDGRIPDDYETFRELPGVGEYIGSAVMSIAFGLPCAAVDGNVKRVLARLFGIDKPVNTSSAAKIFREHADSLLRTERPGDHNQAMMELGATVCRPSNPECEVCPVSGWCEAFRSNRQSDYPVRAPRRKIPRYHIAIGVVQKGNCVLITRREPRGLLGGLWEFPGGKIQEGESGEAACEREILEETNLSVRVVKHMTQVTHAYSHFHIIADVYSCAYEAGNVRLGGPVDYRWVLADEIDDYPFPRANHKFIPLVKQQLKDY